LSAAPVAEGLDDRALAARASRDPQAFAELYRRHVSAIHAFAWRRSGSRHVAEDVTSATFELALASIDRFEWKGGGFVAWLHRIAANELAAHHRREARVDSPRGQTAFLALVPFDTDDDGLNDWPRVRAALDRLRPRYQEVITLRYLSGISADDAATALGISKPVLAVTLHRALRALEREAAR
jgi:RNA polymerase sigma-70 factor (ECF subfamily)